MNNNISSIHNLVKMSICTAILCISAYISFPLPFAAALLTALTITLNLIAFILTPKQTFTVIILYLLLGTAGLPVFVGGMSGVSEILSPRGGFLLSFPFAYTCVSLCKGKNISFTRYFSTALFIGIPLTYLGGVLSVISYLNIDLYHALFISVFPFLPGDIIKAFAAALLGVKINKILTY